jgi:hypothetical protein
MDADIRPSDEINLEELQRDETCETEPTPKPEPQRAASQSAQD